MNDPIKIIHKYKNLNRKKQFHVYIYLGELVPSAIIKILKKIEPLNLYDSWNILDENEIVAMEKEYGSYWYTKFFITPHIKFIINTIIKNTQRKNDIIKKFGNDWYITHIEKSEKEKIKYNFQTVFNEERSELLKKRKNKIENNILESDIAVNFTSTAQGVPIQFGGTNTHFDRDGFLNLFDTQSNTVINNIQHGGNENDDTEEMDDMDVIEEQPEDDSIINLSNEMDLEEIENMFNDEGVQDDKKYKETTQLITQILGDDSSYNIKKDKLYQFNDENDNAMYDAELKNIFTKCYIYGQYIFKDDTINTIKKKITLSIQNNNIFGKTGGKHNSVILPSRMYLWSEYEYENDKNMIKKDYIMIGQKWIQRNEMMLIDIEPNENIRVYESLKGNLKILRDNVLRAGGSKIRREDDEFNILFDYENYIANNEIYMVDIYNELGINYSTSEENLKNLYNVYVRIYFNKIGFDELKQIINYLNISTNSDNLRTDEINNMQKIFSIINNDIIMENEIMYTVEKIKSTPKLYEKMFQQNYITQSDIRLTLFKRKEKIDLYRIFDNFIPNDNYPFIQYSNQEGLPVYKFNEIMTEENKKNLLLKWLEYVPYGINFKIKQLNTGTEKYMSIRFDTTGRVEYNIQWKEDSKIELHDVYKTYNIIKDLIIKINNENIGKIKIPIPNDEDFKFAFFTTIQQFDLPEKYTIKHNDLSDFARYFFPYVTIVVEPRKRRSDKHSQDELQIGKFGTYLRYKRISKYENQSKIEHRINYFMKNYEFTDVQLSTELSKQFNITEKQALENIELFRIKYPIIKKSRKILKKLENLPKYKSPGIDIRIQGKKKENYKIRIAGIKNQEQLTRIISFIHVLLYLYLDTYIYKTPERQELKERLKKLTNVAKRRNLVIEAVEQNDETVTVRQMTNIDKDRLGFKPDKGQNQWTRSCQNSGTEKKRRPQGTANIDDLFKAGYNFNKKSGFYERTITYGKGTKKKSEILRAIEIKTADGSNSIFYTCGPEENDNHKYVGILSKSYNPDGLPMPCCFIKDPMTTKNIKKREYFLKSLGLIKDDGNEINKKSDESDESNMDSSEEKIEEAISGDKLYILQDTNKIQEGRLSFLPKYIEIFFNTAIGNKINMKGHYLIESKKGYYFKYGIKQDNNSFLNSIGACMNLNPQKIKEKMIDVMQKDIHNLLFTSLNNGNICTQFGTREEYISYIQTNEYIDYEYVGELLSKKGIISDNGLNILTIEKRTKIIAETLEKKKIQEDFILLCRNLENTYELFDKSREAIILIKDDKFYSPIFMILKEEDSKNIDSIQTYLYDKNEINIINRLLKYYNVSCSQPLINTEIGLNLLTAKELNIILNNYDDKYHPKYQIIDKRNKCKYLITKNNIVIPVRQSGTLDNIKIYDDIKKILVPYQELLPKLIQIFKDIPSIKLHITGIYYNSKVKDDIKIIAIVVNNNISIPIKDENTTISSVIEFAKLHNISDLSINFEPQNDIIDNEIFKGSDNFIVDKRIIQVKEQLYHSEGYELFRLEFSNLLKRNEKLKQRIMKILTNTKTIKNTKRNDLKKILFRLVNKDLSDLFTKSLQLNNSIDSENITESDDQFLDQSFTEQIGGTIDDIKTEDLFETEKNINNQESGEEQQIGRFVHIYEKPLNLENYELNNQRQLCENNSSNDKCNLNYHCRWSGSNCKFSLNKIMAIEYIGRIVEELINIGIKKQELLQEDNHYVSDIIDYDIYTIRPKQRIIKSSNTNKDAILSELFGEGNIPIIGKRKVAKIVNPIEEKIDTLLQNHGNFYVQPIIMKNNTIFRAYSNCFYWYKNQFAIDYRNLGYYNDIQTNMANYFRSVVIDWLLDKKNNNYVRENLFKYNNKKYSIKDYIVLMGKNENISNDYMIELIVLNKIYPINPIIVYDTYNNILYIIDNGLIYNKHENTKNTKIIEQYTSPEILQKSMHIKYNRIGETDNIISIEVIYYK